jgi:stage V sporulation protein S
MAELEILKVAANSKPVAVAGALAAIIRENAQAELQAIGAGAVNQAVKAISIARGYVAPSGIDLVCVPSFSDVVIDGEERTAIKFVVKPK